MKKYNILALSLLIGGVSTAQTLEDAVKKTENERFDLASGLYKSLISKEATNGNNYYYYGESLVKDDKLDSAKIVWEQGLKSDVENPMNYVGLAKYLWFKGDTTQANVNIDKAFEITKKKYHPQKAEVLRQVASIYIETEKFKKLDASIELLNKAIEIEPNNPDNYIVLGDALELKTPENGSFAIKNYNKALELNPRSPKAVLRTAKLYERAQNPKLANQKFKEAQALDPNFAPAYRGNAELNMKFQQFETAIENWESYIKLNNTIEARYRYATALFQDSKFNLAITELNKLQSEGFSNMYIDRMLAYSYCQVDDIENAVLTGLKHMDAFFKIASKDQILASDYKFKGLLFNKNGQDSLALIELEKATLIDKDNQTDALGDIAEIFIKQKDYTNAIKAFNRKTNGDASLLSVKELYNVAKAYYFGEKNYKAADSCFANLAERAPTYAPAYLWRARSSYSLDENNELWLAKDHFLRFLEVLGEEDMKSNSNKSSVIEACKYLGDYYVKNEANKDIELAKKYWGIVRELSPEDNQAKSFFAVHKL
jgi:tetratricopeptide (TPR) repeat protein